jgi:enoyl-CoA hydratase
MSEVAVLSVIDERGVQKISLNRPDKANALNEEIVDTVLELVREVYSKNIKVLILEGKGNHFCGGFDFSGYLDQSEGDLVLRFVKIEQILQLLRYAPFFTIARVKGAAFGAGADLAISCAYRIGTSSCKFRFPGFQFGVALGTRHLTRIVGEKNAREILLNNQQIESMKALECKLLTHIVEEDDFEKEITQLIENVMKLSHRSLGKILFNTTQDTRNEDMADLVRSVSVPGIHNRIKKYREM